MRHEIFTFGRTQRGMASIFLLLLLTAVAAVWVFFRRRYAFWHERGVPYLTPSVPFGNLSSFCLQRVSFAEAHEQLHRQLDGHAFGGFFSFHRPMLLVRDPNLIRSILVTDFEAFNDHGLNYVEEIDPLSGHLFAMAGDQWKNLRTKLTPTFTSGRIRAMFPLLLQSAKEMRDELRRSADAGDSVEVKDLLTRFSTDVIASCAFGIQCNCLKDPNAEFREWGKRIFEPSLGTAVRGVLNMVFPSVARFFRVANVAPDVTKFFLSLVRDTVGHRKETGQTRKDFLQLLIGLSETHGLTLNEMAAQAFVFFLAGSETSSSVMSFCLYELALNPDLQERLRTEIRAAVGGGEMTCEAVQQMALLDRVVAETLRKYPPLAFLNRKSCRPYRLPGTSVDLPTGTPVVVSLLGLHRDPQLFPDPERFDPNRPRDEDHHRFTYLPFGGGPRTCIGRRFGTLQTKVGLAVLLREFRVEVTSRTAFPLQFDSQDFFLAPRGGMWLGVRAIP